MICGVGLCAPVYEKKPWIGGIPERLREMVRRLAEGERRGKKPVNLVLSRERKQSTSNMMELQDVSWRQLLL